MAMGTTSEYLELKMLNGCTFTVGPHFTLASLDLDENVELLRSVCPLRPIPLNEEVKSRYRDQQT